MIIPGPTPKILVANRGEIAVRVMRTCRELGIPTVAVYSDVDRDALHVEEADEAYHLGPAQPSESYLNVPRLLEAARKSGATMVHPGYGFLSENADFAQAVGDAGLTFIGPPPSAMAMLGDKAEARRAAKEVGAPIVPGTEGPVSTEEAMAVAGEVGFPLLVKAAFGGGGKGMHLVEREEDLAEALERSAREAKAYFGRPEVYLERYIERAHHVEAQILADTHGNVSFLGERDCSLQRRHQKLVEESPSPVVGPGLRARIREAAIGIARRAGYVNAGTVEFLVEADRDAFYFMEVNARLQVEHPVTEMVTGLDLVRLQIMVALGEEVHVEPELRGHAIECRLNAEDPYRDFLPSPGLVTRHRRPGGPFVRLDSGLTEGRAVAGAYDSLFAKLIVWAETRELARRRMLRALDELELDGIATTVPFHKWVLQTDEFIEATHTTKWVERALEDGRFQLPDGAAATQVAPAPSRAPMRMIVEVDGRRVPVALWGDHLRRAPAAPAASHGAGGAAAGHKVVSAPMQGTILQVKIEPGQAIAAGDVVCILEAMKMENHITSDHDGVVKDLMIQKGDVVQADQPLALIE